MRSHEKYQWREISVLLIALVAYIFVSYAYLVVRFRGNFNEVDTTTQTNTIRNAVDAESILSAKSPYSNGMAYTAISMFLVEVTGVSVNELQTHIYPLITPLLALVVFVTFNSLINHKPIALWGTFLLFLQPDFVFVTFRGSHERFTWLFALMMLFTLTRSYYVPARLSTFLRFSLLYYMFCFAITSSNTFFASSYIVALILGFVGGQFLLYLYNWRAPESRGRSHDPIQRLLYLGLSGSIFLYVFIFYVYPPTREILKAVKRLTDQLALIFLGAEESFNPYQSYVFSQWNNTQIYLGITAFTWSLLLCASGVWLAGIIQFYQRKMTIDQLSFPAMLLWLFFPAFSTQLLFATAADRGNALSGNLQVRAFTPVVLLSALLTAIAIWRLLQLLRAKQLRWVMMVATVLVFPLIIGTTFIKASLEPLIGNRLMFATPAENATTNWVADHVVFYQDWIWSGLDERVAVNAVFQNAKLPHIGRGPFLFTHRQTPEDVKYIMYSKIEEVQWNRIDYPYPYLEDKNLIYNNGQTQLTHRRPETPYQK